MGAESRIEWAWHHDVQFRTTGVHDNQLRWLHGRSQYPGTGIAQALCQRVVENHGGAITAESQPDQGATFSVQLPA